MCAISTADNGVYEEMKIKVLGNYWSDNRGETGMEIQHEHTEKDKHAGRSSSDWYE